MLCADDYALAPGVSDAILELIDAGRLTATGAMTGSPFWPAYAARLTERAGRADLGVHLTLTDQAPLGPMPLLAPGGRLPPLGRLLRWALTGRLATPELRAEIAGELTRQIDAFAQATGRAPDFLDGHQHVHQLAGVRETVVALAAERLAPGGYVRVCCEPLAALWRRPAWRRALIIDRLGQPFRRLVAARGLAANDSFRGVRDFSPAEDYPTLFAAFLAGNGARPLVMCHPGHVDDALRRADPVTDAREAEYRFLSGPEMPAALARAGLRLVRFGALAGQPAAETGA